MYVDVFVWHNGAAQRRDNHAWHDPFFRLWQFRTMPHDGAKCVARGDASVSYRGDECQLFANVFDRGNEHHYADV